MRTKKVYLTQLFEHKTIKRTRFAFIVIYGTCLEQLKSLIDVCKYFTVEFLCPVLFKKALGNTK